MRAAAPVLMPSTPTLHWDARTLQARLAPLLPGLRVEVVASVGSTSTELLERVRRAGNALLPGQTDADLSPCLLVAEHQTQGRGRQGKDWQSSVGASLTFSLALPLAPPDWSGLSLAVGLALAEALDPARPGLPPRLGLKWPNDLLLRDSTSGTPGPTGPIDPPGQANTTGPIGRKLGGILIETVMLGRQRVAVIGIGLNLRPQTTPGLSWGYACLQELSPGLDAPAALAAVAPPLLRALRAFERHGFAPLHPRFAARDLLLGRRVLTSLPGLPGGLADGVDQTGKLWLRVSGDAAGSPGERRVPVTSGEISLRADLGSDTAPAPSPELPSELPPARPPAPPSPTPC